MKLLWTSLVTLPIQVCCIDSFYALLRWLAGLLRYFWCLSMGILYCLSTLLMSGVHFFAQACVLCWLFTLHSSSILLCEILRCILAFAHQCQRAHERFSIVICRPGGLEQFGLYRKKTVHPCKACAAAYLLATEKYMYAYPLYACIYGMFGSRASPIGWANVPPVTYYGTRSR